MPDRSGLRLPAAILLALLLLPAAPACNTGDEEPELSTAGLTANSRFVADATPDCPRADVLSLQLDSNVGSLVSLSLTLTNCASDLDVSGVAFEISYDPSVIDFLGCEAGGLFPQAQLIPGTPACTETAGNTILGTIAIGSQQSVKVGGTGIAEVMKLNFNIIGQGVDSQTDFVGTDNLASSGIWFTDPQTGVPQIQGLGAGGYAGGRFLSR